MTSLLIGWSFHKPAVIGCEGLASRAQANTARRSGTAASMYPEFEGSLKRSQARTRGSLPNAVSTPFVYDSSPAQVRESKRRRVPGARTQPELRTPGFGAGCGPGFALSFQQESNRTKT